MKIVVGVISVRLRHTMASPDAATRQGVCTGLKEVRGAGVYVCVGRG